MMVPVWRSGNALDSINKVTLHRAQLVPGRMTIFQRVYHPATKPDTQVDTAWAVPPWVSKSEYWL